MGMFKTTIKIQYLAIKQPIYLPANKNLFGHWS